MSTLSYPEIVELLETTLIVSKDVPMPRTGKISAYAQAAADKVTRDQVLMDLNRALSAQDVTSEFAELLVGVAG